MTRGSFGGGFKVGRIFGIPIILDFSFFLIFLLAVWWFSELFSAADGLQRWGSHTAKILSTKFYSQRKPHPFPAMGVA